ncbi:small-conductance mechanosensitive channel [Albidovulum inexpectatum]|uniref:Small-conductance mechanosensitive channel n=1 Tax=Albidovulum inexpectatum TaxID=196587 RepID=A0A2S5JI20_9RHOB|nr:mechanosensitive ion channel family protein [Albidovulum inexpectatum]PPB81174.1 small-conductance mechanosensitive channel [Albidovulum inexpectatum]
MTRLRVLILVAGLALVGLGTSGAMAQDQPPAEPAPIALDGGDGKLDEQISTRLRHILEALGQYDEVTVTVSDGVVRLEGTVLDATSKAQLEELAGRIEGVVAVENATEIGGDIEQRLAPAWDRLAARGRDILASLPVLLVATAAGLAIALTGGWLVVRVIPWQRLAPNSFVADVYRMVGRLVFVILGVVVALEILNATALLGAVLGAAGLVGLAVGFAVRDTVENFIASLLLSLRQPFRPDDLVEIEGDLGRVARLTSRATILISPDGNHIRIPNTTVFKGRIVNYTRAPNRRFEFQLGVDAEADHSTALATGIAAIERLDFVLNDPPVAAWIQDVGDSNVVLTFTGWVDQTRTDFNKARGAAIEAAKVALEENGFGLPEPIYRLKLESQSGTLTSSSAPAREDDARSSGAEKGMTVTTRLPRAAHPEAAADPTRAVAQEERRQAGEEGNLLNSQSDEE